MKFWNSSNKKRRLVKVKNNSCERITPKWFKRSCSWRKDL